MRLPEDEDQQNESFQTHQKVYDRRLDAAVVVSRSVSCNSGWVKSCSWDARGFGSLHKQPDLHAVSPVNGLEGVENC